MDPNEAPRTATTTSARPPSGRPLLWAAAGLVLVSTALLFLLVPSKVVPHDGMKEPPPGTVNEPAEEEEPPSRVPAVLPSAAPRPRSVEPTVAATPLGSTDLFAGNVPELLDMTRKVVVSGGRLKSSRLKEVYEYAKENPTDARPQLIMAADAANRGWIEFAINHYERAFKADPRAREDARMLEDLVRLSTSEHHGKKAEDSLLGIYGSSAVPAVLAAADKMTAEGHAAKAERLVRLSNALSDAPPSP
jgi:hypothetical protein